MSGVPYIFGNATTSIPLSQLDVNFATNATLGNATVGLGNTTTTVGNLTVQNVTLSSTNGDANINGLTVGKGGGASNTVFGVNALALAGNTGDVAVGNNAGSLKTTTSDTAQSTFVGYYAGAAVNTGVDNTFIGGVAGRNTTTGGNNVVLGGYSFFTNTIGSYNVSIGKDSLRSNTTASNNTAVGYQAGYTNATGSANSFFGYQAGYTSAVSSTTAGNTCIGAVTGYGLTTGTYNTFVGFGASVGGVGAGYYVTTGSKNTILGGYNGNQGGLDIRTLSNYIVLSDGDGNPRMWSDGSGNFTINSGSQVNNSSQFYSYATSSQSAITGNAVNASQIADICLMRATRNTTNGTFRAYAYYNDGAGAYKYYVIDSGAIYSTSTSITSLSDQRFKENIKDIDVGLDAVMALKPRRFDWIDGKGENRKNAVGFIAQEVQQVLPDLVSTYEQSPEDKTEYLAIRQSDLVPTLVKAIQELKAEVDSLKAQINGASA